LKSILYVGCPPSERAQIQALFAAADLSVIWAERAARVVAGASGQELPVLLDLAAGPAVLRVLEELRSHGTSALVFAVADLRRPDLTLEAVLAGVADVFTRPLDAEQVLRAIRREQVPSRDTPARRRIANRIISDTAN
jgi:DNA-binding NtrC family response regulator